jgi:hypothetical protein
MSTVRRSSTAGKDVTKGLVRQPGGTMRENKDGSIECTEKFRCLYTVALAQKPVRNETQHPLFKSLYCQDVAVVELEAGMAEVIVTYIGDAATDGGVLSSSRLPDPSYDLLTEANEAPIETFPNFATTLGTTANGAKYDANNLFLGFDKTSEFVGISGFLSPNVVWRESGYRRTKPSGTELNQVGKINVPTGVEVPPTVASPRNWLLRAFIYTYEGRIYRYQKEWLLSGPRGWNSVIHS